MKNDTRSAIMAACRDINRAHEDLLRILNKVDRYAIRIGLHSALRELSDACTEIDEYCKDREVGIEMRAARAALDKAILDLTPHSKWFEVWGDSEERR